jgi:hypothetical protein
VATETDTLPHLPQVPDQPRSLYAPAAPGIRVVPPEGPFFVCDPRLDPPELPPPGWFATVDAAVVYPHLKNRVVNAVQVGNNPPDVVILPAANLNWAVTPEVSAGYRLPSGFGEFYATYRGLATDGTGKVGGPAAPLSLKSRLDFNYGELSYASREISLWPKADCKWWVGVRYASTYFDSVGQDFPAVPAPGMVLAQRTTNSFVGIGPHAGLLLSHRLCLAGVPGLALYGRLDASSLYGRVRQQTFEEAVPLTPPDQTTGAVGVSGSQGAVIVNLQAGLTWQPPGWCGTLFSLGYVYEHWWNVGLLNPAILPNSSGEFYYQGVTLRAEFNF